MTDTEFLMLKNNTSLAVAFYNAGGMFEGLLNNDTTLIEFLQCCANNNIQLKASYKGQRHE